MKNIHQRNLYQTQAQGTGGKVSEEKVSGVEIRAGMLKLRERFADRHIGKYQKFPAQ